MIEILIAISVLLNFYFIARYMVYQEINQEILEANEILKEKNDWQAKKIEQLIDDINYLHTYH